MTVKSDKINLSIVTALYNGETTIAEFIERCMTVGDDFEGSYEIIIVDDGSADRSVEIVTSLMQTYNHITLVELSRNFGQHQALRIGLNHTKGDLVFLLDSDLEEDPAWFTKFHDIFNQQNVDLVYGVREKRRKKWGKHFSGLGFFHIFNLLTPFNLAANMTSARLMSRRFVNVIVGMKEYKAFLPGLFGYAGFNHVTVPVHKHSSDTTTYSTFKRWSLALNAITSFSSRPLYYLMVCGLLIGLFAVLFLSVYVLMALKTGASINLLVIILASIWMIAGGLLASIGLIGFYIARIFDEVKTRPYAVIKQTTHSSAKS